jgi:hypothetical protein
MVMIIEDTCITRYAGKEYSAIVNITYHEDELNKKDLIHTINRVHNELSTRIEEIENKLQELSGLALRDKSIYHKNGNVNDDHPIMIKMEQHKKEIKWLKKLWRSF